MNLHLMQQVKRLFAWADAHDDTRNMELHMQVAFGLLAEQGATTTPKRVLDDEQLEQREQPLLREVQLSQAFRWERAALATKIAGALHCSFIWIGSLTQEVPTLGYFVGCAPHVDRARLLFEVMDPDLRLLTRFIGPIAGKGTGPGGAPSGDGMDYYRSRSAAMIDVVSWIGERLFETEALAAARAGLVGDFAEDCQAADRYVDDMWGDTANVLARAEGLPDLPMVDGLPAERFREFLEELDELEATEDEYAEDTDEHDSGFEDTDYDPDADPDDDFDYSFDFLDEEECDEDSKEEYDAEGDAEEDAEGEHDEDDEEFDPSSTDSLALFDLPGAGYPSESPAESTIADATWVYFIEDECDENVDPCLIRFGAGGWQLYYPAMGQWHRDDAAEEMAMETGLFVRTNRLDAEEWVEILDNPSDDEDTGQPRTVEAEIDKCLALGFDEDTARQVVRMRWANLPDALLSE